MSVFHGSRSLRPCGFVLAALIAVGAGAEEPTAWLGVRLGRAELAGGETQDATTPAGVRIVGVFEGSAADAIGLRAQDVIRAVDGRAVATSQDLIDAVRGYAPGSWVEFSITRKGKDRDLRAELTTIPEDRSAMRIRRGWIGAQAIDLPPALLGHFGAPDESGAMISGIDESGPARAAGLELGDVVFEVDGEPVESAQGFAGRIAMAGVGNEVEISLARSGALLAVEAVIEAEE